MPPIDRFDARFFKPVSMAVRAGRSRRSDHNLVTRFPTEWIAIETQEVVTGN
jgi:hypothetical protein